MVFIVMQIGSDAIFVQGTRMVNSLMWPERKLNGRFSSSSSTSKRKSKFWNDTSPPHMDIYGGE